MQLKVTKIKETCLYIKDIEQTKQFYHEKLGLPVISQVEGQHIFFRAGSSVLLCFIAESSRKKASPPPHYGEGNLHFAFEVAMEEYADWMKHIQSLGLEIEEEVTWQKGLKSFYFRDPDKHAVEIVMPGIWGD